MDKQEINDDPMMVGCMIFSTPFFLLTGWIILAVIFNWK
jgi:hypothetical protein